VLAPELVEHGIGFAGPAAQAGEERLLLLGMVLALGEDVEIEKRLEDARSIFAPRSRRSRTSASSAASTAAIERCSE
jgi:hypothetical protein